MPHTGGRIECSQLISAFRWTSWRRKGDRMDISNVLTKDLVEELSKRIGVETTIAEPYQDVQIKVNGPAIVMVVID